MVYGALKFLTGSKMAQSLSLARRGRVYQLGWVLDENSPSHPFHGPLFYATFRRVRDSLRMWRGSFGAMNVRLEMSDHTGTHIDALNHVSRGHMLYGGRSVDELETERGTVELGGENFHPIITRGLLFDIAASRGRDILEDDYLITLDDVTRALKLEGIDEPSEGDAVLVRTGWGSLWKRDNKRYIGPPMPGISLEVAKWLSKKRVVLVGGDTPSVERILVDPPGAPHEEPVHQHLIVDEGIFMLENLNLEELSREKVYQFLFICIPLRVRGATASPVNPLAIA
ncbi:MAG: cyclase family protein [Nitrososphaerota archaeon]